MIFIHGCFWHQHRRCIDGRLPKSRTSYWIPKLVRNKQRDVSSRRALARLGWRSLVIWDCETVDVQKLKKTIIQFLETRS